MKKIITTLLFLTLLLSACSSNSTPTETFLATEESATAESTASENSSQTQSGREAVLSEIENDVSAQTESSSEFLSASVGMVIPVGGTIRTGDDSRVKVDL